MKFVSKYVNYLGIVLLYGRFKNEIFDSVKGLVSKKLNGWKGNLFLKAGKKVLIKVVVRIIFILWVFICFQFRLLIIYTKFSYGFGEVILGV